MRQARVGNRMRKRGSQLIQKGSSFRSYLLISLVVCLLSRMFFFLAVQPWNERVEKRVILQADASGYHHLGVTLKEHHRLAFSEESSPEALRTPAYPFFIASIYTLFGNSPWIVILFQIPISLLSCWIFFLIVTKVSDVRSAFCASLLFALDPFLILYTNLLYSETLFILFSLLGSFFLLRGIAKSSEKKFLSFIFSAFLFGIAGLTRPVVMYLPFLIVILLICIYGRNFKKSILYAGIFTAVFFLTLTPWMLRNKRIYDTFSLSISKSLNFLVLQVVPIKMDLEDKPLQECQRLLMEEANARMVQKGLDPRDLNLFERSPYWEELGWEYIKKYPGLFVKNYVIGIALNLSGLGTYPLAETLGLVHHRETFDPRDYSDLTEMRDNWIDRKNGVQVFIGIIVGLFLILCYVSLAIGFRRAWKNLDRRSVLLVLGMILYFMLITGAAVHIRFKAPVIPYYLVFSGIGLNWLSALCVKCQKNDRKPAKSESSS